MDLRSWASGVLLAGIALAGCAAPGADAPRPPEGRELARQLVEGAEGLMEAERFDLAVRRLHRATAADPFAYRAHYRLGNCYYELGEYDLEIGEYRKCVAINPNYAPAWRALGHAAASEDDLDLARRAYYRYLDLAGSRSEGLGPVLYNLALVEGDLGNEARSEALLARYRSLRSGPDGP